MTSSNKFSPPPVLAYAICIVIGLLAGKNLYQGSTKGNKILDIFNKVDDYYVDDVDINKLEEHTITSMLNYLDPHSYYLNAEIMRSEQEQMQGNFDGIGVQFKIIEDTICVLKAIKNGPSMKAGIQAGDRLIAVNKEVFVGDSITNELAMQRLKGPKGSSVELTLLRNRKTLDFLIERGTIPLKSVPVASMIDNETGYIKINRFASKTYEEFMEGANRLAQQNMQKLVLDLRGNPGGLMHSVVAICEEFLQKGQLIVYTKGRSDKEEERAQKTGVFSKLPVVILIDENSASASEILAGALQDHDRGTIIGRRSFGKGLVQRPFNLRDGSALRLTISRYYTPVGRCIQKDYGKNNDEYFSESYKRFENGELSTMDSIPIADSLKFTTPKGKKVYGGGGIIPDYFIPLDTSIYNSVYQQITLSNTLTRYYLLHVAQWKSRLQPLSVKAAYEQLRGSKIPQEFKEFVQTQLHLDINSTAYKNASKQLHQILFAQFLESSFEEEGYYLPLLEKDAAVQAAIKIH